MTKQEARKWMENIWVNCDEMCPSEQREVCETSSMAYDPPCHIARNISIECIEKQIPKEPDIEGDGYWNGELVYDTWICPCCGEHYEIEFEKYKYCPECGQAVDLSEVE